MASRSLYNERLHFSDPSGVNSASRSTRYRNRKKAKLQQGNEHYEVTSEQMEQQIDELLSMESQQASPSTSTNTSCIDNTAHAVAYDTQIVDDTSATSCCDIPDIIDDPSENPSFLEAEVLDFETDEDNNTEDTTTSCLPTSHLYDGSSLTVATSNIMIMQYKIRHNLTDQALADLLQLLQIHCPIPNNIPPSIYHFKKNFQDKNFTMKLNYFCSSCLQSTNQSDNCCKNHLCGKLFNDDGDKSSFIEVPIEPQIQALFESKPFY